MLTGTYTLEHASWERLSNEDPEQIGVTQEQVSDLLERVDLAWEMAVAEEGLAHNVLLSVEWVGTFTQAHVCSLDNDDIDLAREIESGMADALEHATERATDAWSKKIGSLYDQANQRVQDTPELASHYNVIMADWPEGDEHYRWVCTAPIAEIVDWAERTAAGN